MIYGELFAAQAGIFNLINVAFSINLLILMKICASVTFYSMEISGEGINGGGRLINCYALENLPRNESWVMTGSSERYLNEEVLNTLIGENSLLDVLLTKIEILQKEYETMVSLEFKMRKKSNYEFIRLQFSGVQEYGFYSGSNFGNHIERYKFFLSHNGLYYISLDPFDESHKVSEQDQDFVISKSVTFSEI